MSLLRLDAVMRSVPPSAAAIQLPPIIHGGGHGDSAKHGGDGAPDRVDSLESGQGVRQQDCKRDTREPYRPD